MTPSLIAGCLWVLGGTIVALLPMRLQFVPGVTLLFMAPLLLGWIAYENGPVIAGIAAFAVLSLFRRPLMYFAKRAMGKA